METRVVVVGIITRQDEILLGKKAKGRAPYPDVWHTPGGGVENTEKALKLIEEKKFDDPYFHEELQREIKEETGIKITNIRNICPNVREVPREDVTENKNNEPTRYIFLEFLADYLSGDVKASDDLAEVQWAKRKDLGVIPLTPPSQAMYKELGWL
jgi:ADP-ribose pyrophosphatase YjhB (NUDIX family)